MVILLETTISLILCIDPSCSENECRCNFILFFEEGKPLVSTSIGANSFIVIHLKGNLTFQLTKGESEKQNVLNTLTHHIAYYRHGTPPIRVDKSRAIIFK